MTAIPKKPWKEKMEKPKSPSTPYHRLEMTVYKVGNREILHRRVCKATKGKVFSEEGVEAALNELADTLEKELPNQEFRLVELSGGRFKFMNETKPFVNLGEVRDVNILFKADIKPDDEGLDD